MKPITTSVAITDPLIKYQSLVSSKLIAPDQSQHRLAVHLQKIYNRLKDYTPSSEYSHRLAQVTKAIQSSRQVEHDVSTSLSTDSHPIRRNPLFARFLSRSEPGRDARALVKVLTGYQGALDADSPQGLFLSGEVGTGKSMLLDLLADGLPTKGKKRWHFNTFMLYTLSQLEKHRKQYTCPEKTEHREDHGHIGEEYSLLWVAKRIIQDSPILFLDEFQLPDRAASKIMAHLFTAFFQLGGVLVASSNRMPEDLENAIGSTFVPPTGGGVLAQMLGLGFKNRRGELFGASSDFAMFLEVLKARCEFWQMEGGKDWRREQQNVKASTRDKTEITVAADAPADDQVPDEPSADSICSGELPSRYSLFENTLASIHGYGQIPWAPLSVTVYGRQLAIPCQHKGISHWTFSDLVGSFGPADYITLASTFHTFIIDEVPILTLAHKNEARRFITLLDALYECRCKLFVRAEAGPDDLFFPDVSEPSLSTGVSGKPRPVAPSKASCSSPQTSAANDFEGEDATYSETISEAYQDATSPFRPNISAYSDTSSGTSFNDQDMDFEGTGLEKEHRPNFRNTSAFTGEDERFAYKRAASRLWEMCSERWHSRGSSSNLGAAHDVQETPGWWNPLPKEARHWEKNPPSRPQEVRSESLGSKGDISFGPSFEVEEPAGLERLWRNFRR